MVSKSLCSGIHPESSINFVGSATNSAGSLNNLPLKDQCYGTSFTSTNFLTMSRLE